MRYVTGIGIVSSKTSRSSTSYARAGCAGLLVLRPGYAEPVSRRVQYAKLLFSWHLLNAMKCAKDGGLLRVSL